MLLMTGCYNGPEAGMEGDGSASVGDDDDDVMTGPATTGEIDCIPGNETCVCLNGGCAGNLHCVDEICVPGPVVDEFDDRAVIGGVRVPLEIEIQADSFSWEQTGGPTADNVQGQMDLTLLVDVPADANPGARMVFTLTAVRNTIESQYEFGIEILPAEFSNFLNMIDDPEQAGTVEGLDIRENDAWVISTEGFVSRFDPEGAFIARTDIPGAPYGGHFGDLPTGNDNEINVMYVANQMTETVEALVLETDEIRMVTNQMTMGGALGPVDYVLPVGNDGGDGELFFTNREGGQVFHYYFDNEAETWNTVEFVADLGTNPNALAEGPDQGYIYVGTVGRVWRVPVLEDGTAGAAEVYLNLGPQTDLTLEVDGITFDETGTMYVGTPGTSSLHMARYRANGETQVVRSFSDVGGRISSFVNVQFGDGDFGGGTLYWTNLDTGAVGRLPVGLGGL